MWLCKMNKKYREKVQRLREDFVYISREEVRTILIKDRLNKRLFNLAQWEFEEVISFGRKDVKFKEVSDIGVNKYRLIVLLKFL